MPLETGTYIDSLNVSNPAATDVVEKADDHLRLIKSTIKNTFPNITGAVTATHTELNKLAGVTASAAELNYLVGVTSAIQTQLNNKQASDSELSAIAGLVSAADRLPYFTGAGTAALATFTTAGRALVDDADATAQRTTLGLGAAALLGTASTTDVLTGTSTTAAVTPDALAALWEQAADVASAGTVSLGDGGYFNITGTTTITDIDLATDKTGRKVWVKFAGALTLTNGAALILPGGANITTAAGDTACFISEGTDVVRCVCYTKANGQAISGGGATLLATIATTSGGEQGTTGLTLTSYKFLYIVMVGMSSAVGTPNYRISGSAGASQVQVTPALGAGTDLMNAIVIIDLTDGTFTSSSVVTNAANSSAVATAYAGDCNITTASTAVYISQSVQNFDAGSVRIYGVK